MVILDPKLGVYLIDILLVALLFGNDESLEEHRMVTSGERVPTTCGAATDAHAE